MAIVIKKRVSLEFLGDEYKEAYLTFKSIPLKDYNAILDELPDDEGDNKQAMTLIVKYLKEYFVDGEFPDEGKLVKVTSEDIEDLDASTAIHCFQTLMGQTLDPKVPMPSKSPSSTVPDGQES